MPKAIASFAYCFGLLAALLPTACSAGGAAPASGASSGAAGTSTGSGGTIGIGGSASGGSGNLDPLIRTCELGMCTDFPEEPLTDGNPPSNAAALFGEPGNISP